MNNINYSLSLQLSHLLTAQGLCLAVAESCTGGGLASEITAVPGSSRYFDRAFITYSNQAKTDLLAVPATLLATKGAVSAEVAKAMAEGVLAHSNADIAVSVTGIAGPEGGTPEKPVGLVWFGLVEKGQTVQAKAADFAGGRKYIRRLAIGYALQWIIDRLS